MKALSRSLEAAVMAALDAPLLIIEPVPTSDAPTDLDTLLEATADESAGEGCPGWSREYGTGRQICRIPVWNGASDRTIWSAPEVNYAFRALHEYEHILQCAGFDVDGERIVADAQASKLGETRAERVILFAETFGQVLYFQRWNRFPRDQRAFVVRCVRRGIPWAVDKGGL